MAAPRRAWLTVAYLLFAATGATALLWTSPSVSQAGRVWARTWAVFFLLGGLLAAYGAWRRRWYAEYAGLPLLVTVWAVYGLAAGWVAVQGRLSALPGCLGLLAVAGLLGARWQAVEADRRAARRGADYRATADPPP
jgi:peptidoglycan/LPS O-acetylase OafA/YrhL